MPSIKGAASETVQAFKPALEQAGQAIEEAGKLTFQGTPSQPQNPQEQARQQQATALREKTRSQGIATAWRRIEHFKREYQMRQSVKSLEQQKEQARQQAEAEKMKQGFQVKQPKIIPFPGKGKDSLAVSMERGKAENKARKAA